MKSNGQMKAVRFHQHGGPEVLRYEDAPEPELNPGEVLVRVRACALNFLDVWERRGLEHVTIPMPHISGSDVAGEVVASAAGEVAIGRRVMLQPGMSCGRCAACLSGKDNECPQFETLGYRNHPGGYAEYVKVPAQNLVLVEEDANGRVVYLPRYGWPAMDEAARQAWGRLGFTTRPIDGLTISAMYGGALRCKGARAMTRTPSFDSGS